MFKKIFLISSLSFFSFAFLSFAIPSSVQSANDAPSQLVPNCGGKDEPRCTICHLFKGIQNIVNWLMYIMVFVALFVLTLSGITYIISTGSSGLTTLAKDGIKYSLAGIVIVLSAVLIINFILSALSADESGTWNSIECSTHYEEGGDQRSESSGTGSSGTGGGGSSSPGIDEIGKTEWDARESLWEDSGGQITVWESSDGATQVNGLRDETRQDLLDFQKDAGVPVIVTGAAEQDGPHADGKYSHANGYKVDIEDSSKVNNYIENNYVLIGHRSGDNAEVWRKKGTENLIGNKDYMVRESTHWDGYFNTPSPPLIAA